MEWSQKNTNEDVGSIHFVMEATGAYHEALAYALHKARAKVSIVNPARISSYAKSLGATNVHGGKTAASSVALVWCNV
ncbi:MAG TPA: hypothetical protein ENI94_03595 [Gammaproteobacteria bacterium]|nr:hypothetical protein [Gammaproteobacteria bacterium]